MPTEIVGIVQSLGPIVEKLGVTGLLIGALVWLMHERMRLMKEARRCNVRSEMVELKYERARAAALGAGEVVDVADLDERLRAALLEIG